MSNGLASEPLREQGAGEMDDPPGIGTMTFAKAKWLLPPLVSLLLCAAWIAAERARGLDFQARADAARASPSARPGPLAGDPMAMLRSKIRALADLPKGAAGSRRAWVELGALLRSLDAAGLDAAIAEIESARGLGGHRDEIHWTIVHLLAARDPLGVLERWGDHLASPKDSLRSGSAYMALSDLACSDLDAAIRWVDEARAAGWLDARNLNGYPFAQMQAELLLSQSLVVQDPEAFVKRMAALDRPDAREILRREVLGWVESREAELGYARAAIRWLPENEAALLLAEHGWMTLRSRGYGDAGYDHAKRWIEESGLGEERRASVIDPMIALTLRDRSRDLWENLDWAASMTPDRDPDEVATAVLAELTLRSLFQPSGEEAVGRVVEYALHGEGDVWLDRFFAEIHQQEASPHEVYRRERFEEAVREALSEAHESSPDSE